MGGRVTLSQLEFDVLWEHLDIGRRPPILAVGSPGRTQRERAELRAQVWTSLAAKDLGQPPEIDRRLERMLHRLANPIWELDARIQLTDTGARTWALIAKMHKAATIAVLDDEGITLRELKNDPLAESATRLLPAHAAGAGNSITLPAAALDKAAAKAGSDPDRLARALAAAGLGKAETRKLTDVLASITRQAHFGAAHTPPDHDRRRASYVVSVYDTTSARYLFTRRKEWVTLLPGTQPAISRHLDELLTTITSR